LPVLGKKKFPQVIEFIFFFISFARLQRARGRASLSMPNRAIAVLTTLLLAGPSRSVASAPPASAPSTSTSCSACTAVARALSFRLASEAPRNDLDWRGRVGPTGDRTGVRLAYVESEQRLTDLLDGLCTDEDGDGVGQGAVWWNAPAGGGGRWAAKGEALPQGWTAPTSRAEREARAKELENYCGRLLEGAEDGLAGALLAKKGGGGGGGGGTDDVGALLCERLTQHCPPGQGAIGTGGAGSGRKEEDREL
jgi:hypothetical protein